MARTKAKSEKPKFSTEVAEIFSQLKNEGLKLSMLKEAALIKKLSAKHKIKPAVIQKQTRMSLPHVYNLINLASMSPKMKAYVMAGKLKGTDALAILRKAKDEKEFVKLADEVVNNKVDRRLKENKKVVSTASKKKVEEPTNQPKKGRGRPRKQETPVTVEVVKKIETPVGSENISARKEKIRSLVLNFLGKKKVTKQLDKSLNQLVENLISHN
ncbi:MAG: hypothetical protein RLZ10_212 [Bacteroidota bacterium]|jgi:hypothetical protein